MNELIHRSRRFRAGLLIVALVGACGGGSRVRTPMPDPLADVSGEELFEQGLEFAQNGDPQRAEQYFVASMEKGHPSDTVMPMLIRLCIAQQRYSAALAYAEPELADAPGNWGLRRIVASLYHGLDRVEDARTNYHQVLEAAPDDAVTHYLLGMLYLEDRSAPSEARPLLERYLELAPEGEHAEEVQNLIARGFRRIERIERVEITNASSDADPAPAEDTQAPSGDVPSEEPETETP